jgi:ABC-type glycerol-3-phosphate transport system substrate-binding protein
MKKNTWKSRFFISLLLLSGFIHACTGSNTPVISPVPSATPRPIMIPTITVTPTEDTIQGTITIWHSWEDAQRNALFRRIAAFQAIYPNVQFDVLYIPVIDLEDSFNEAMGENAGPTILIGPAIWGPDLYQKQSVVDLTPYAGAKLLGTLNPAAVGSGRYRQMLLSLPLHIQGVVLYRNTSIIPIAPPTFNSLVTQSIAATQSGKVGAMLERSFYFSVAHLYGLGGELMDADGNPNFNKGDYQASLAWLDLLREFDRAGPSQFQTDSDLKLFKDRRLGFLIESTSQLYNLAGEIDPLNLAVDPWPTYKDGHLSGFVQSEGAYLTPRAISEEDMVSWLFVQFLLTPDSQVTFAGVGYLPAIKPELIESNNLRIGDPFIAQSMVALSGGTGYPSAPELHLYEPRIDLLIQSVISQGAKAKDALQLTYANIQSDLATWREQQTAQPGG